MILGELIDALIEMIYSIIYKLFSSICVLIDFIKTIFYKLCGIETVDIGGEQTDLLSNLITSDSIRRVFLTITIIGFILLTVFTIIAIIKSNYQEKQNWKTVLSKAFHGLIIMFIIPATIMAGILLTNTIMGSINQGMQANLVNGNGTIGGQFLVTIGSNAYTGSAGSREQIEAMFISGQLDYNSLSTVKMYYDITSMNYVIGLIGGLVILVMFVISSITFVQRIFDIVLLYIISPVSISTIPLDEGNRFKVWKDMLISKILSAYGIILVMNLFFLIIPQVYQINFFNNNFHNGIVYILFLIGGSFAVTKASRVISQLTGAPATGGELAQMIYNIRSGIALSRATTAMVGGVVGGLVGGSDYKQLRKKGKSRGESVNASLHSTRNQHVVQEGQKKSKAKQVAGAPLRLATLPIGMLSDLSKGGLIQLGKNFIPRLKNVVAGDSLLNRAEIKKKAKTKIDESVKNNTNGNTGGDTGGGVTEQANTDTNNNNTVSERINDTIINKDEENNDSPPTNTDSEREFKGPDLKEGEDDEGGGNNK